MWRCTRNVGSALKGGIENGDAREEEDGSLRPGRQIT
jgi:hypothetical protein